MDFFEKVEKLAEDLSWNVPEQKRGRIEVIGGSKGSFRAVVKTAEFVAGKYPVKEVEMVVPESLRGVLPELPNVKFVGATESGALGEEKELEEAFFSGDYNLVMGDLSKNAQTGQILVKILAKVEKPTLITRDTVDLVVETGAERMLENERIVIFASLVQMQKLFRSVLYPKMLTLSQSLVQVAESLHKFTLSYPVKIVTLHSGQILVADGGVVKAVPLEKTEFLPMTVWNGELAAKIGALNLYSVGNFVGATLTAILG